MRLAFRSTRSIVCILKGFKPQGDDNRPDRGALPFAAMLLNENIKVLTLLFGPIVPTNAKKLLADYKSLFNGNGLWKSIIGLSDLIIVDSPYVNSTDTIKSVIYNSDFKNSILDNNQTVANILVSDIPNRYQENDVDAIIHYTFKYLLDMQSFECMCNPPGGDWSGLSILLDSKEYRWLSLPRVSPHGKRPDHVIEFLDFAKFKVLLSIESKEKANDLENNIGEALKYYLQHLFSYKPSVVKKVESSDWEIASDLCNFSDIIYITAGAFLKTENIEVQALFERTKCDIFFILSPNIEHKQWNIELHCKPQVRDIALQIVSKAKKQNDIVLNII